MPERSRRGSGRTSGATKPDSSANPPLLPSYWVTGMPVCASSLGDRPVGNVTAEPPRVGGSWPDSDNHTFLSQGHALPVRACWASIPLMTGAAISAVVSLAPFGRYKPDPKLHLPSVQ